MKGWKTKTGSIGMILVALGTMANQAAQGDFDFTQPLAMLFAGFTALGIGHKIDKAAR